MSDDEPWKYFDKNRRPRSLQNIKRSPRSWKTTNANTADVDVVWLWCRRKLLVKVSTKSYSSRRWVTLFIFIAILFHVIVVATTTATTMKHHNHHPNHTPPHILPKSKNNSNHDDPLQAHFNFVFSKSTKRTRKYRRFYRFFRNTIRKAGAF